MHSLEEDYERLVRDNRQIILDGIVGTSTSWQVESAVFFARYLRHVGVTSANYWLHLRVIETNNCYVVDELLGPNNPRLLFSVIKPNLSLVRRLFELVSMWHPGQIYWKVLVSILGAIEYNYHNADEGYTTYPLDISDVNNLGKFLNPEADQFEQVNAAILDILDRLSMLGQIDRSPRKTVVAKHAHSIRMAYFDNTKTLTDSIPSVLLVRLDREETETKPTAPLIRYLRDHGHASDSV